MSVMLDGMSRLRETTINCELGPAGRERSSCVFLDDASRTVTMTVVFDLSKYVVTKPFTMPMAESDQG